MVKGGPQGLHLREDLQTLCIVVCFFLQVVLSLE